MNKTDNIVVYKYRLKYFKSINQMACDINTFMNKLIYIYRTIYYLVH